MEVVKHSCYCCPELAANLDRQVKSQPGGASQKELEDMKMQMEKSKNNLIFENFKQRNVCEYPLCYNAVWSGPSIELMN